jgi:hypothetical protein
MYQEVLGRFTFVKIPSVRVASTEAGAGESPSLGRLLDTLEAVLVRTGATRSTALQQDFRQKMTPVEALILDTLNQSAASIRNELPFQEASIEFRLPEPRAALRGMLEAAVVESRGDANVPLSARGTGFQSALVMGVLRYVAEREAASGANLMFAIEEPEAFLHPQTQRAMASILRDIAKKAQLLITTHSSVIVDSFEIGRIARLPLLPDGVELRWRLPALTKAQAGRLTRHCSAANSELVFANAVVLVEGEGDRAVVDKLLSHLCRSAGGHYALGITVIDAGGVTSIAHLIDLANLFGVRWFALSDGDTVRKSGGRRHLLDLLEKGNPPISRADADAVRRLADQQVHTLTGALATQSEINRILAPYGAFILISDLEGMLLDSLRVQGVVDVLGPEGEGVMDEAFGSALLQNGRTGYEECARWMGSKGWNSTRKTTGKLDPHLPPVLLESRLTTRSPGKVLQPLMDWLSEIIGGAKLTPL